MSNLSDPILNQINSKLEKANTELTQKHLELTELEKTVLRLERARSALNDDLILPSKRSNNMNFSKEVYDFVSSHRNLSGSEIIHQGKFPEGSTYAVLSQYVRKGQLIKSIDKRYSLPPIFPVVDNPTGQDHA